MHHVAFSWAMKKNLGGCLGCLGEKTTQLCGDFFDKPVYLVKISCPTSHDQKTSTADAFWKGNSQIPLFPLAEIFFHLAKL